MDYERKAKRRIRDTMHQVRKHKGYLIKQNRFSINRWSNGILCSYSISVHSRLLAVVLSSSLRLCERHFFILHLYLYHATCILHLISFFALKDFLWCDTDKHFQSEALCNEQVSGFLPTYAGDDVCAHTRSTRLT
jgi:hypothetical protein